MGARRSLSGGAVASDAPGREARRRMAQWKTWEKADEVTFQEVMGVAYKSKRYEHLTMVRVRLFQLRPRATQKAGPPSPFQGYPLGKSNE
jgi:hypothetical protein